MKRSPMPLMLLLASICGAGCYTILKHPGPAIDMTDDTGTQAECVDCHADADLYHLPGGYDNSWYSNYPAPWAAYYGSPWWFGDEYWNRPRGSNSSMQPVQPEERHLWTRDANVGGALPTQGNGNVTPPANAGNSTSTPPQSTKENADKNKKEKEKEKRHVWGR